MGTVPMVKCAIVVGQETGCGSVDGFDLLGLVTQDAHVLFVTHRTAAVECRMH